MDAQGGQLRQRATTALALLAAVAGAACEVEPPAGLTPTSLWETSLAPSAPDAPVLLTGQAAVVVRSSGMEAGIGIEGIQEDMVLSWGVFRGECATPGEIIARPDSYPLLTPDAPQAEVWIGAVLSTGQRYHVAVSRQDDGTRLACGNLTRIQEGGST